jgi:L-alanine-DL-glutamate epimerase-like enolase superfamily enzyme
VRLSWETLPLETTFEFRIAHGSHRQYQNLLVRLEHDGIIGLGEASASHYYGETLELMEAALAAWAPHLGEDPWARDAIHERLDGVLQGHGAARAAIDSALHDWIGKALGQPTWRLFGVDPARTPQSCVTLGLASPEEMERKLDTVRDFPMLKVKLGAQGDVDNLRRIRARFSGRIRVDRWPAATWTGWPGCARAPASRCSRTRAVTG